MNEREKRRTEGEVLVERRGGRGSAPEPEKDAKTDDDDAIEE